MEAWPPFMNKALAVVLLKWHGIGLSVVSFFYGFRLYLNNVTLSEAGTYDKLAELIDLRVVAAAFMLVGLIKLIGIITNKRSFRVVGVVALAVLWTVIGITFLPTPNTIAVLTLGYAWTAIGISIREDFR